MNFSQHVAWKELVHDGEDPPAESIPLVRALCESVLEPIREWAGEPLIFTSGYRPPERNEAAGGSNKSQHKWTGDAVAVDFKFGSHRLEECFDYIRASGRLDFDQCILEFGKAKGDWRCIHISLRRTSNRRMCGIGATGNRSPYEWLPVEPLRT